MTFSPFPSATTVGLIYMNPGERGGNIEFILWDYRKRDQRPEVGYRGPGDQRGCNFSPETQRKHRWPERSIWAARFHGLIDVNEWKDTMSYL